jgi:ribonucleoside-diphosphate reductase alpha chain
MWHTCPAGEDGKYGEKYNRINATNPCSEYAFLDDTSCNLASINVFPFYDRQAGISTRFVYACCRIYPARFGSFHSLGTISDADIARKTHLFRTTASASQTSHRF